MSSDELVVSEARLESMSRDELVVHIAHLSQVVADQQATIDNLRAVVDKNLVARKDLAERVDDHNDRLDELERDVDLTAASVPSQSKTKVQNVQAILRYAVEDANGGVGGVIVDTGAATAAIDGSRSTARRLMDDIAGRFEWATVKNPGGPQPKQLRLAIRGMDWTEIHEEIAQVYGSHNNNDSNQQPAGESIGGP